MNAAFCAVILTAALGQDQAASDRAASAPLFGVRGTVLDVDAKPHAGAQVRLILERERGACLADETRTDDHGRFSTKGWITSELEEEGPWRLEVRAANRATSVLDHLIGGSRFYDVGTIFLFEPVDVSGVVLDEIGRPVAGAKIYSAPGEATWSRHDASRQPVVCESDASGRFRFRSLPPGQTKLGVEALGFADHTVQADLNSAPGANVLEMRLENERLLTGVVVDSRGIPIPGAVVEAKASAFWRKASVTNAEGSFEVRGLSAYWLPSWRVRALGFGSFESHEFLPASRQVVLQSSRRIGILALRDGAGDPPAIRRLTLSDSMHPYLCSFAYFPVGIAHDPLLVQVLGPNYWSVYVDAAVEPNKRSGIWRGELSAVSVNMSDGCVDRVELGGELPWPNEVVVRARATGGVRGRVLAWPNSTPVAGATVVRYAPSGVEPTLWTTTDADGRFAFDRMAAGTQHTLVVNESRWRGGLHGFEVQPGALTEDLKLVVSPTPTVFGRVSVDGNAPGQRIVVGLGEILKDHVVPGGRFGIGISDAEGNYIVVPTDSRKLTVVPKRPATPQQGGYRNFLAEFPQTRRETWPFEVEVPRRGQARLDLDLSLLKAIDLERND